MMEKIGEGAFASVRRVLRYFKDSEEDEEVHSLEYAMKIIHKKTMENTPLVR
jgi:hypothetical protein